MTILLAKVEDDLKKRLKAKDKLAVATLRVLLAEIRNQVIAQRGTKDENLKDEQIVALVQKEIKKGREAIQLYHRGHRPELAEKEEKEIKILSNYLPHQVSAEELGKIVAKTIEELGVKEPGDFGKVMGAVMGKVKGRADGSQVAAVVKRVLASA